MSETDDRAVDFGHEALAQYHLAASLQWALRHPYHGYPVGMPETWARAIEAAHVAAWHWSRAGYWVIVPTRAGDELLAWASELEAQHPWLSR